MIYFPKRIASITRSRDKKDFIYTLFDCEQSGDRDASLICDDKFFFG